MWHNTNYIYVYRIQLDTIEYIRKFYFNLKTRILNTTHNIIIASLMYTTTNYSGNIKPFKETTLGIRLVQKVTMVRTTDFNEKY